MYLKIENSGYYSIRIYQNSAYPIDTLRLQNIQINNQKGGRGGLFINLLSYKSVNIIKSSFQRNAVPSVILFLRVILHVNSFSAKILLIFTTTKHIAKH